MNVEPAIDANIWSPEGEGENEEEEEEAADTPAAGSGSRPSSASSGAVEAESLVAGSGHPASSVSSGRVEAEGCGSWKYNEGVGGQYTCAGCGARPFRSAFLIEATNLEGNLCVERDFEGRLHGRCYECCRGRGPHGGEDMCADLVPMTPDDMLANIFKKECNKRHLKRSDVKKK